MDSNDIVEIPGYPGLYTRNIVVQMWQSAGSPPINDAGRLFWQQLEARLAFENGTGSPADDPRRPDLYPLAHVRFAALDVANWARDAMRAVGFEYPYGYEPWHAQLPNIYSYPLVSDIPLSASINFNQPVTAAPKEDDMYAIRQTGVADSGIIIRDGNAPYALPQNVYDAIRGALGLDDRQVAGWMYETVVREQWRAFNTHKSLMEQGVDTDDAKAITESVTAEIRADIDKLRSELPKA